MTTWIEYRDDDAVTWHDTSSDPPPKRARIRVLSEPDTDRYCFVRDYEVSGHHLDQARTAAALAVRDLGITSCPIGWIKRTDDTGPETFAPRDFRLPVRGVRGFYLDLPEAGACVFVRADLPASGVRDTVMHELRHRQQGESGAFERMDFDERETDASRYAAAAVKYYQARRYDPRCDSRYLTRRIW